MEKTNKEMYDLLDSWYYTDNKRDLLKARNILIKEENKIVLKHKKHCNKQTGMVSSNIDNVIDLLGYKKRN